MNKIGIIGAMSSEIELLKNSMKITETTEMSGMIFYEGTLSNKNIVLVKSGVGKVNAAICAQTLICIFKVDAIINTGVAGALSNKLNIGDIVVSIDAIQYDMNVTALGYAIGVIPDMDNPKFEGDKYLIEAAIKSNNELGDSVQVYEGRVMTADLFLANEEKKQELVNNFNGWCAEMEGAAIAHACYVNHTPFLIIRSISDKADNSAHMNYPEFEKKAAAHSSKMLEVMLGKLM
jgi:adenosylhomocysteine nucleosidase